MNCEPLVLDWFLTAVESLSYETFTGRASAMAGKYLRILPVAYKMSQKLTANHDPSFF